MVSMISMPTPRVLVGLADRANATLPHLPVSTRLGNFLRPPGSPSTLERYRGSWEGSRRRRGGHSSSSLSRSEEHTSELQSLMRISYDVFCLKNKKQHHITIVILIQSNN